MTSEPLIRLCDIGMRWDNKQVLADVNLTIRRGDFLVLSGPNGGGKTTLLRIILGLLRPTRGTVEYFAGQQSCGHLPHTGYLPQKNMVDTRFPVSVTDVIQSGLLGHSRGSRQADNEALGEMLRRLELESLAHRPISDLSGGQLQRTMLGRALVAQPSLLVLDEPLSYIDHRFSDKIADIIADYYDNGRNTVVMVSHHHTRLERMANTHYECGHFQN